MSSIRKQSLISSAIVYIGFALGFLNTYLFTREGGFTEAQYGLTNTFIALANIMYAVANLGMPSFIYKFYPYYKDNLPPSKRDMVTWSLVTSIAGFVIVVLGGVLFRSLIIRKFSENSPELVTYFYWIFPFGFGLTIYSLLEAFAWQLNKSVLTTYFREVQFRLLTTLLIVFSLLGILTSFDTFIKLYAFGYIVIALALLLYLVFTRQIYITFKVSRVTYKFRKKILALCAFVWSGGLVFHIAQFFDSLVLAAVMENGMLYVGVYSLAQNISSLIQAPQRGIIAAAIPPLSQAWKDKDLGRINRIYKRSSINQLIFAVAMFVLVWINFTDGVVTFHLKETYHLARNVFLFIGLMRVIDLGTGVNAQIIGTSTLWRFEFVTGMILLAITLPFNYLLAKAYGVSGPAISNLFAFTIYNAIRYVFLYRRFGLQPFTGKTLYTLLLGVAGYLVCHFLFRDQQGLLWIIARSAVFLAIYIPGVFMLNLSEDIIPVLQTALKKIGWKK